MSINDDILLFYLNKFIKDLVVGLFFYHKYIKGTSHRGVEQPGSSSGS